jgi:hypothetical protein
MIDNPDSDLLKLFEEKNLELPEEPFRAELRRRIEKARAGYGRMYWFLTALALAVCAASATFVIDGITFACMESIRFIIRFNIAYDSGLSSVFSELSRVTQIILGFLATPTGWAVAAGAALLPLAFQRRVLSIFE